MASFVAHHARALSRVISSTLLRQEELAGDLNVYSQRMFIGNFLEQFCTVRFQLPRRMGNTSVLAGVLQLNLQWPVLTYNDMMAFVLEAQYGINSRRIIINPELLERYASGVPCPSVLLVEAGSGYLEHVYAKLSQLFPDLWKFTLPFLVVSVG